MRINFSLSLYELTKMLGSPSEKLDGHESTVSASCNHYSKAMEQKTKKGSGEKQNQLQGYQLSIHELVAICVMSSERIASSLMCSRWWVIS